MRESTWLKCDKATPLLGHLQGKGSDRKLRLFACACSRCLPDLPGEQRGQRAVEVAEQYADGTETRANLCAAGKAALPDFRVSRYERHPALFTVAEAARACAYADAWHAASLTAFTVRRVGIPHAVLVALLRDVFGNPFHPLSLPPALRTTTVLALAEVAYAERLLPNGQLDPARLAVLADALEEVGADDALLGHLRGPGVHVRGCHVVDALLGRE